MIPPTSQSGLQDIQVPCNLQPLPQHLQATAKQPCTPLPVHQLTQSYRPEPASQIVHHLSTQQQAVAPQGTLQTKILDKYVVLSSYSMMVPTTNEDVHILYTIIPLRC